MKITPPVPVSVDKMSIDVSEIEGLLQATPMNLPPWPDASFLLGDGRTMFIRAMTNDDVPQLLDFMKLVMEEEKDFYNIVGARVYSEILAVKVKRLKDGFTLLGLIDGEFVGFANGRFWDKDIAISLHTMAFSRRGKWVGQCIMPRPTMHWKLSKHNNGGQHLNHTMDGEWLV